MEMWVLIVVTAMSNVGTTDSISVAMQEFGDQYSCQRAERMVNQLVGQTPVRPGAARYVRSDCVPKSEVRQPPSN